MTDYSCKNKLKREKYKNMSELENDCFVGHYSLIISVGSSSLPSFFFKCYWNIIYIASNSTTDLHSSVIFSKFIKLYNHHHNPVWTFSSPPYSLCLFVVNPTPTSTSTDLLSVSTDLLFYGNYIWMWSSEVFLFPASFT